MAAKKTIMRVLRVAQRIFHYQVGSLYIAVHEVKSDRVPHTMIKPFYLDTPKEGDYERAVREAILNRLGMIHK